MSSELTTDLNFGNAYLKLQLIGPSKSGKTNEYAVFNRDMTIHLGDIKWFSRWRQYCFFPTSDTVFNNGCMEAIATMTAALSAAHRRGLRENRS